MSKPTALIAGATGATAFRLVEHLATDRGWNVVGVSRNPPGAASPIRHVRADLMNAASSREALGGLTDVTHIIYAARAPHGESGIEDVAMNVAMLENVLDAVVPAARDLAHVHLVEGGKWYGLHLGPYRTPAREDDPRHMPPNFYYDQQDLLERVRAGKRWSWSASRPNVICDFAPGRARNLVSVVAAYAVLCREFGVPLDFPGSAASYDSLTEVTDARLLARAIGWMISTPAAADQAFNVTNGDLFRWRHAWPRIAGYFGVPAGEPRPFVLSRWMHDKGPAWQALAAREGLAEPDLERVADWSFADFVFGQEHDVASDVGRLRRAGFGDSVDSLEMFDAHFRAYQEAGILP